MDKADLNALRAFVAIVRAGGFAAAARKLGIPRSTVSLRLRTLEQTLGVRLFKRSTRVISLTTEGQALYEAGAGPLDILESTLSGIGVAAGELKGPIRITAPADFPIAPLAAAIASFRKLHPRVTFEVVLTNAVLDLVAENIDIAIRMGVASHQDTVHRAVASYGYGLFASPDYVAARGEVRTLDDIDAFIAPPRGVRRYLEARLFAGEVIPRVAVEADNYRLARDLAVRGGGVAVLPAELIRDDLESGELVRVLAGHFAGEVTMKLAFPTRADMSPRVRAFAEVLAEAIAQHHAEPRSSEQRGR